MPRLGRARVIDGILAQDRRAFVVAERQSFTFYGAGLDDYESVALRAPGADSPIALSVMVHGDGVHDLAWLVP